MGAPLWGFARAPGEPVVAEVAPKRIDAAASQSLAAGRAAARPALPGVGHALATPDPAPTLWRIRSRDGAVRRVGAEGGSDRDPQRPRPAQHDARRLLAAVLAAYPAHSIFVPPMMRAEVATAAFEAMGFVQSPLHQLQMRLALR